METLITGIYIITNKKDNKVYIGQALNFKKRKYVHFSLLKNNKHYNKHLQASYNKYGKESFNFIVLLYCDKEYMTMFEQLVVDSYINKNIEIYNFLTKCVDSWFGMNHSKETINKLKEKLSGENNHNYGKRFSNEHKKKIGESNKGKIRTPEGLKRLSEAHIGKGLGQKNPNSKLSDEERREIHRLLTETILTQKKIADMYNIHPSTISNIKRRKQKCQERLSATK